MFCVDMAPCWRFPCHVLGGGFSPSQGGWSDFSWPVGHSDSYVQACSCEYGQILRANGSYRDPSGPGVSCSASLSQL